MKNDKTSKTGIKANINIKPKKKNQQVQQIEIE